MLQCINLFWFFFIVKIALNVVFANVAQDIRSEDEDEDEMLDNKSGVKNGHTNAARGTLETGKGKKEL